MVYTQQSGSPQYQLHALNLGNLADKVSPKTVSASHTLTDSSTFSFNATYQRQRPCVAPGKRQCVCRLWEFLRRSRQRLPRMAARLGSRLAHTIGIQRPVRSSRPHRRTTFFCLPSGCPCYGPAADDSGKSSSVTGNSDYSGTTYDGVTNIQESVIKTSAPIYRLCSTFSRLPTGPPSIRETSTSAQAESWCFPTSKVPVLTWPWLPVRTAICISWTKTILEATRPPPTTFLGTYGIGGCWCGPSYYVDPSDSIPRVVSSGGNYVQVYQVLTSPSPSLNQVSQSTSVPNGSNGGGFLYLHLFQRPQRRHYLGLVAPRFVRHGNVHLFAFNPDSGSTTLRPVYNESAGSWKYPTGNSNLVPVVASGQVFVASYKVLNIFGLTEGRHQHNAHLGNESGKLWSVCNFDGSSNCSGRRHAHRNRNLPQRD